VASVAGGTLTFLVCHGTLLTLDRLDPDLDHRLTVALGPAILLGPLLFEDEDLPCADLAENLRGDLDAFQGLGAGPDAVVARHEDDAAARERERLALLERLARRALDPDDVARGDLQLLTAGADDGVHESRES